MTKAGTLSSLRTDVQGVIGCTVGGHEHQNSEGWLLKLRRPDGRERGAREYLIIELSAPRPDEMGRCVFGRRAGLSFLTLIVRT